MLSDRPSKVEKGNGNEDKPKRAAHHYDRVLRGNRRWIVLRRLPAAAQGAKTYVMKLCTATLNDTQHEWMKRFAAAVTKDSAGRIKAEVYPASQLGSIPRQIEGTQFGSIQAWIGPPEFLVGVDQRYEALSAPGMFASQDQDVKVIQDPAVGP